MYSGQEAIDYLAIEARADDPKASSHWRQFHSDFIFTGESFSGLVGFGGNASDSSRIKRLYTSFLQRPFRNMGKKYQSFERLERVAKAITKSQKREYDLDVMRQVITLSFLQANSPSSLCIKESPSFK